MRILVFGAGAVGSVFGGFLAHAGHAVTLLGRPEHMAAVRARGLRVEGLWGRLLVPGVETAQQLRELDERAFDLIILTVKSYDTPAAIEAMRQLKHDAASIVSVQNGYGNTQALQAAFGSSPVYGARIITGVELVEPGQVLVTVSADDVRLGPPAGEADMMAGAKTLAGVLRQAGLPVTATDRYCEFLWSKILYNCALNPVGALLRATYGELVSEPGTRRLVKTLIEESFTVAQSKRIPLFWDQAEDYCRHFFDELIPPTAQHYPSMLRDLERHGRTEIDALNGAIVRLARETGSSVPLNEMLTSMIRLRERTRREELGHQSAEVSVTG